MPGNFDNLGKLSLAILENYVQTILGEKFVDQLRAPTDKLIAIGTALKNTEDRFTKQFEDRTFAEHIFKRQIGDTNAGILADAIAKYHARPTDPDFPTALKRIFTDSLPHIPTDRIDNAVNCYIHILTEELALADEKFRENVRALADLHGEQSQHEMVQVLKRVEALLKAHQSFPPIHPTSLTRLHQLPSPLRNIHRAGKRAKRLVNPDPNRWHYHLRHSRHGGIGKTALALKLAGMLAHQYPDGQFFLDMKGLKNQDALTTVDAMKHVIVSFEPSTKLPDEPQQLAAIYRSLLNGKKVILLWDNVSGEDQVKDLLVKGLLHACNFPPALHTSGSQTTRSIDLNPKRCPRSDPKNRSPNKKSRC